MSLAYNIESLFEEQSQARKPLTKEGLSLYLETTYFGNELKENDLVLNFLLVHEGGRFTLEQATPSELPQLKKLKLFHETKPFPTYQKV